MCMIESLCLFVPKHISVGAVFPIPFETPVYFFCFARSQVHPILHKEMSIILKKSAKSGKLKTRAFG